MSCGEIGGVVEGDNFAEHTSVRLVEGGPGELIDLLPYNALYWRRS